MIASTFIATGVCFGISAVIFGAFGAHALSKTLTTEQLKSFETGVKYQMYHAVVLLLLGFSRAELPAPIYWCFTIGILLFSFSIYGLVLTASKNKKWRFLGPVTPIGGLLLIAGWFFIGFNYI